MTPPDQEPDVPDAEPTTDTTSPSPDTGPDAAPDAGPDAPPAFADLGLREELVKALDQLGYEEPTPIQAEAIPPLLEGRDLLGQAATGTGKTAAFALPLLQRIPDEVDRGRQPIGLVLVPTRELAMQVSEAIHTYGKAMGARVLPIYGGQPIFRQLKQLDRGVDIVVATPGRAMDHLGRGSLALDSLEVVVLDEADEMLDMGFAEDIEAILEQAPAERQTTLFSATLPRRISYLADRHLNNPVRIQIKREEPAEGEAPKVKEVVYVVTRHHKPAALARVLDVEDPAATIVFCRTRLEVDELTSTMNGRGYRAEALHGGMDQGMRDRVMNRFRSGAAELLIATDVAARGLDIDTLTHVVNHSLPSAVESYTHRIGRVGRAGREGMAISLVEPREHRAMKAIERHTGRKMQVETVPTVADLRARRLGMLRASMRELLLADGDDLDTFRPVVESLSDEFDLVEIALAGIKLAHDETHSDADDDDVPEASFSGKGKGDKGGYQGKNSRGGSGGGKPRSSSGPTTKLWMNLGREAGMRPKDLVGAIANETSLTGRDVGAIQIHGRFSLVEVPAAAAEEVISSLMRTKIRGKKAKVREDKIT